MTSDAVTSDARTWPPERLAAELSLAQVRQRLMLLNMVRRQHVRGGGSTNDFSATGGLDEQATALVQAEQILRREQLGSPSDAVIGLQAAKMVAKAKGGR
jgi:hypothetical protein